MNRFFKLVELFFDPTVDKLVKKIISDLFIRLNILTEDNQILLSGIPSKEDIEESIDSLILNSERIMEMKNNLFIVKKLDLLSLQEETALANRLLGEIGFSEEIESKITEN